MPAPSSFFGVWERPPCKDFRQDRGAPRQGKRIERDPPERHQHKNEGKHHSEHPGTRADLQAARIFGTIGHARHHQLFGSRAERAQHGRLRKNRGQRPEARND
eukprot:12127716-Heterocapsa_arctica.AAC.1